MPEFNQNYNFNSLYFLLLLYLFNIWNSNYEYINIVLNKLYLLNYISLMIIINIIGLYLILRNLSFEVNIKYTIKYNNV